ncbi:cobalamin B12-binding domain-containing protein [Desulforhabdus amnigena]|jgi:methylmalonyl-CoA mutase C-terminal domain/subunit|uniref:Methylmalonyl-CoA mutase n=1 Tax=Desulforhabdus amnigena TaxID=40218 RepID=A0A9W6D469_9BACT|nr:cobalamin B12-binding domain-containing protein [Desulforhabdus amnigena]NLJ29235.1 cobalamin B12-binding domain-containing protein [Deltaproteobacteria bacterium]GLI34253.1 methylmalonyl-CoA mutase [Desulforhabdus amnigena]
MAKKIKIIVAKPGLDGHDRGAKLLSRIFAEAGMEVVYTGLRQTPEMIVETALQEDADVVGLSSLSGVHNYFFPKVVELLRAKGLNDVLVVGGGIIPLEDYDGLKKAGMSAIFGPGTPTTEIVDFIQKNVRAR